MNKERSDRSYERMSDAKMYRTAKERYDNMPDEEKEALLKKVINYFELEKVDKIVKDNYYEIKTDILEIFDDEGIEEYEDEEDEGNPAAEPVREPERAGGASSSGAAASGGGATIPQDIQMNTPGGPAVSAEDIDIF